MQGDYLTKTNPAEAYPKYVKAEKWYRETINSFPQNLDAAFHLGLMISKQVTYLKNLRKIIEAFQKCNEAIDHISNYLEKCADNVRANDELALLKAIHIELKQQLEKALEVESESESSSKTKLNSHSSSVPNWKPDQTLKRSRDSESEDKNEPLLKKQKTTNNTPGENSQENC